MLDNRDPAIKLFGKTIALPAGEYGMEAAGFATTEEGSGDLEASVEKKRVGEEGEEKEQHNEERFHQNKPEVNDKDQRDVSSDKAASPVPCSAANDIPRTPSLDKESSPAKALKLEEVPGETNDIKEKPLKKPDKILPCPRCNSLDTKFCYYNNYNVNQPRHFCKNCQRYWTAGGTMRNVPMGAGRRKNKNSAAYYRHITVSETIDSARADTPEAILRAPLKPSGTVLSFGSDAPLCESMASVLNLAEKTVRNCQRNGFHRPEEQKVAVSNGGDNGDEHSSESSITASNSAEDRSWVNLTEPGTRNCAGFAPRIAGFPGAPWTYPWNPPQWNSAIAPPPPPPPLSPFCASSFPISFYPAATYWGCSIPGTWSVPWIAPVSPKPRSLGSGSNSPTLGKHPREGSTCKPSDPDQEDSNKEGSLKRCLWIPKTLRIDDPGEAARSSIWATLGIRPDKAEAVSGGGLFKAFQPKVQEKTHTAEANQVLHANPAALSRSLNFHERSLTGW